MASKIEDYISHKTSSSYDKTHRNYKILPGAALPHKEQKNLVITERTQESHEQPGLQQKNE